MFYSMSVIDVALLYDWSVRIIYSYLAVFFNNRISPSMQTFRNRHVGLQIKIIFRS